jgi:L-aspartate oxidase
MATRAGVETQDLEYVQFHPTALLIPNEARFLLSEALRGEGAVLRKLQGEAFAKNFHQDADLAPRDIVARGVFEEAQRTGSSSHTRHHSP